jgi:hypothetical protein
MPKRKAIPLAVKYAVLARQFGRCAGGCGGLVGYLVVGVGWRSTFGVEWDHRPSLAMRKIRGNDWSPPQHSAKHIDCLCKPCHDRRTFGTKATSLSSDAHSRAKVKRLQRGRKKPRRPIKSRDFSRRLSRKMDGTVIRRQ